jgi:hypothetical protein
MRLVYNPIKNKKIMKYNLQNNLILKIKLKKINKNKY